MRILLIIAIFFISFDLIAQDEELAEDFDKKTSIEIDSLPIDRACNMVYLDAGSLNLIFVVMGYASLNYEREIFKYFGLRAGYGVSGINGGSSDESSNGYLLMFSFHTRGDHKFNLAAGRNFLSIDDNDWQYIIAASVSYRYQPLRGGLFLSAGVDFMFSVAAFNFGIGYVF